MIGLQRGIVSLAEHHSEWAHLAAKTIDMLWSVLGDDAVDIQHVGSTSIPGIAAKPIIDIAIGMRDLRVIEQYRAALVEHQVIYRGQDVSDQLLFVMGDFEKDTRTHHIHVVQWNERRWNDYINFRDYLRCYEDKAREYEALKCDLAQTYASDRAAYTAGKAEMIAGLLREAEIWKGEDRWQK